MIACPHRHRMTIVPGGWQRCLDCEAYFDPLAPTSRPTGWQRFKAWWLECWA